jgi:Carboxypeptidase regulatory-like domain
MIRINWTWFLALSVALSLAGCGGGGEQPAATEQGGGGEAASSAPAAAPVDPATAATITGKIAFTGQKPQQIRIRMDAVPACTKANPDPVYVQDVVVNDNGTLSNVFVYVKEGLPNQKFPMPSGDVELEQKGCMYHPHVLGLMVGQSLKVQNDDPTNHNVHPLPMQNREWNQSQPPGSSPIEQSFARPEIMIPVKCNVHPWMISYVGVLPHPFFSVTGSDGTFEIKGLPPGNYVIEAWHEKYGTFTQNVTVGASETKEVDFSIQG